MVWDLGLLRNEQTRLLKFSRVLRFSVLKFGKTEIYQLFFMLQPSRKAGKLKRRTIPNY